MVKQVAISDNINTVLLEDLDSFVSYNVYIRIGCAMDNSGPLSTAVSFTTLASGELLL